MKLFPKWLLLDDILVGFSAIFFMIAHWTTQYFKGYIFQTSVTAEQAQRTFELIERNPAADIFFTLGDMSIIFSFLIMPAFILTMYFMIRRYFGAKNPWLRSQTAMIFFFVAFLDASNDLSFLFGILAQG